MVDVSEKPVVRREAWARGFIRLRPETVAAISDSEVPKGDVLATARIAAIQAAKRTWELIPLCHQLPLSKVAVDFELRTDGIEITGYAKTDARTGVEMEALTAVQIGLLTIYDMCKAADRGMVMGGIRVLHKSGGKSGEWVAAQEPAA